MDDHRPEPEKPSLPSDEDIAARFERIREELKAMALPELPDDPNVSRLTSATPSGGNRMPEVPNLEIPKSAAKKADGTPGNYNYRSLGIGMSAAYSLVGAMAVGFGIGWACDHYLHTAYGQVIGGMLGSILGIAAAMFLIYSDGGKP